MTEPCECEDTLPISIPGIHSFFRQADIDAGVIGGVERHDECARFEGDLEAALALAAHLSTTRNEYWEVRWVAQDDTDPDDDDTTYRTFDGTPVPDDVYIATGTDPWLVRLETA